MSTNDNDPDEGGYALVVSFPDQSESFALGHESGRLWERMALNLRSEIEETTHTGNREVIRRMADYLGWSVTVTATEIEGWDFTVLRKIKPQRERANPHGLRAI